MPLLLKSRSRPGETSGLLVFPMLLPPIQSQTLFPQLSRLAAPLDASTLTLPSHEPSDNTFADKLEFLKNLHQHVCLAKPDMWLSLLSGLPPDGLATHRWAQEQTDYKLALWSGHLETALREGLQHPVLIPGESPLGQYDRYLLTPISSVAYSALARGLSAPLVRPFHKSVQSYFQNGPQRNAPRWERHESRGSRIRAPVRATQP